MRRMLAKTSKISYFRFVHRRSLHYSDAGWEFSIASASMIGSFFNRHSKNTVHEKNINKGKDP